MTTHCSRTDKAIVPAGYNHINTKTSLYQFPIAQVRRQQSLSSFLQRGHVVAQSPLSLLVFDMSSAPLLAAMRFLVDRVTDHYSAQGEVPFQRR